MADNDQVGSDDHARVRSCPLYSTCFTANIVAPASPKCGNNFCSRLPARKSRQQIRMPTILPALMIGVAAWVTTRRRRNPKHQLTGRRARSPEQGRLHRQALRAASRTQRLPPADGRHHAGGRPVVAVDGADLLVSARSCIHKRSGVMRRTQCPPWPIAAEFVRQRIMSRWGQNQTSRGSAIFSPSRVGS